VEANVAPMLVRSVLVAAIVYALAVRFAYWRIPRSRHWGPGTLVAFLGAVFGTMVSAPLGMGASVLGTALGALAFVFSAVKVGTPASVVLTVDCEGVSGDVKELEATGQRAPFVWPYHFSVEKYGHVSFELVGEPGTEVTLEFPTETTPFGRDREGKPRSRFQGVVPGTIQAAPVVRPSQGKFTVTKRNPKTGETVVNDPTWSVPKRKE
jgi:hypothetical protein